MRKLIFENVIKTFGAVKAINRLNLQITEG